MSEFRQDRTSGIWTIIAPERHKRPHDVAGIGKSAADPLPRFDPSCPFCPGNEHALPPIMEEVASSDPPGWRVRVVPNKFPIVTASDIPPSDPLRAGFGVHEVFIETPRHDADLPDLAETDIQALVESWHRRFIAALARPGIESALLFRNRGKSAGASLGHAHSQLIA